MCVGRTSGKGKLDGQGRREPREEEQRLHGGTCKRRKDAEGTQQIGTKGKRRHERVSRIVYSWHKHVGVPLQQRGADGQIQWTWEQYDNYGRRVWPKGPRDKKLRAIWSGIGQEHWRWKTNGAIYEVPRWREERVPEAYMLYYKPTRKGYARVAYNGHLDRFRKRWNKRWQEGDLVTRVLRTSDSIYDWILWQVKRFQGRWRGHQHF